MIDRFLPGRRGHPPGIPWLLAVPFLAVVTAGAVGIQTARGAQEQPACDVPSHGGLVIQTIQSLAGEDRIFYFKTPTLRCPDGVLISADSAVVYESTNYNNFIGNVVFEDQKSRLTAQQAQYFSDQRRLTASGNPVLTDLAEGSVIRGDRMVMNRAGPGQEEDHLTVSGRRPHATLFPKPVPPPVDSAGQGGPGVDTLAAADPTVAPDLAEPDTAADSTAAPSPARPDTTTAAGPLPAPADSLPVPTDTLGGGAEGAAQDTSAVAAPGETENAAEPGDESRVQPAEDEPEEPRVPYEIDASRFVLEGTRYFRATGSVVVTRDSLRAEADSLDYDQEEGALFLSEGASVTTAQTDLSARSIRLAIPQDEIREALATGDAVLEGEDLRLLAPVITLFFREGNVERLVAVRDAVADSAYAELEEEEREALMEEAALPPVVVQELGLAEFPRRPYALAQDFLLRGDSVDVLVPGEILREVRAVGSARGESAGRDSLNAPETPELIGRDWLEGDTILAFFREVEDSVGAEVPSPEDPEVPAQEADSTEAEYQLEELVARGRARSMYRMAASDSTVAEDPGRFAVHYVVGDQITILLNAEGEAEKMEVVGQTRGIHLEPIQREDVPPDTVAVPDTSGVGGTGGGG